MKHFHFWSENTEQCIERLLKFVRTELRSSHTNGGAGIDRGESRR
jgi:hypothetical protein